MDVGIRELKAKLSEYLDRASRGEIIRVTERGKPKAWLVPFRNPSVDERIKQGIAEGWIIPRRSNAPPSVGRPVKASATIQEMMDEDRGD